MRRRLQSDRVQRPPRADRVVQRRIECGGGGRLASRARQNSIVREGTVTDFLQLFFSGLSTGAIYGLAALGFTLLWQASGTINFAQGEFVMLPAFMMLAFGAMGLPLPLAFLFTCVVAVLVLGWAF